MPTGDDGIVITVQVTNPQEVKSTIGSYTTYDIVGEDKEGKLIFTQASSSANDVTVISTRCEMPWC